MCWVVVHAQGAGELSPPPHCGLRSVRGVSRQLCWRNSGKNINSWHSSQLPTHSGGNAGACHRTVCPVRRRDLDDGSDLRCDQGAPAASRGFWPVKPAMTTLMPSWMLAASQLGRACQSDADHDCRVRSNDAVESRRIPAMMPTTSHLFCDWDDPWSEPGSTCSAVRRRSKRPAHD